MVGISAYQAALLCVRTGLESTRQERRVALAMRRVFAQAADPDAFIAAMPETQPYRDRSAIERLFDSLSMRIGDWQASSSCYLVRVSRQEAQDRHPFGPQAPRRGTVH